MSHSLSTLKKVVWFSLGMIFLGIAYIGVVTPGIPWSTPTVCAAFCFAKSSKRWHNWIMHHPLFGPFLTNWAEHRVFPRRGKILMFVTMDISLIVLWFTTQNIWLVLCVGTVMLLVTIWAWRFPETVEQAQERISQGRKLGWFGRF